MNFSKFARKIRRGVPKSSNLSLSMLLKTLNHGSLHGALILLEQFIFEYLQTDHSATQERTPIRTYFREF